MTQQTQGPLRRAVYCDVDGTLGSTTIVTPLLWFKRCQTSPALFQLWRASLLLRGPWWLLLDRFSREASNRAIYRQYRGMPSEQVRARAARCFEECFRPRLFAGALERLARLRAEGYALVLVTGGLDFQMRPLAEHLQAELIAPGLIEENGSFTGELTCAPLTGAGKAQAVLDHSRTHGIALGESYAFGDAYGDLPMLEAVGRPVAMNPDRRLARIAQARGWLIERWK